MDKVLLFIKVLCLMIESIVSFPKLYSNGFEEATNRIYDGLTAKYESLNFIFLKEINDRLFSFCDCLITSVK